MSLFLLTFTLVSCSHLKSPERKTSSVIDSGCRKIGTEPLQIDVCEGDKILSTLGHKLVGPNYADQDYFSVYVLKDGVCTYDKKYCVGDTIESGDKVAGIFVKTNRYAPNNPEVMAHGMLLQNPETGMFKEYSDNDFKLEHNYKILKKYVEYKGRCYNLPAYEGELEDYSSEAERAVFPTDNSNKCTLFEKKYLYQNIEATPENLSDNKNFYGNIMVPSAMSPEKIKEQKFSESFYEKSDPGNTWWKRDFKFDIKKDPKTNEPKSFSLHYKLKNAKSMLRIVPLFTVDDTSFKCVNLKKVEVNFCVGLTTFKEPIEGFYNDIRFDSLRLSPFFSDLADERNMKSIEDRFKYFKIDGL